MDFKGHATAGSDRQWVPVETFRFARHIVDDRLNDEIDP
jgi:hypothetical protein